MGTTDRAKNRAYVAKHRAMKMEQMGATQYKEEKAQEMQDYRTKEKTRNKEEYLKKNAEYMRDYRRRQTNNTELNKKMEASKISKGMIEDLLKQVLEGIPEKRKVGRPRKTK